MTQRNFQPHVKLDAAQRAKIVRLATQGMETSILATRFGVNFSTIRLLVREAESARAIGEGG